MNWRICTRMLTSQPRKGLETTASGTTSWLQHILITCYIQVPQLKWTLVVKDIAVMTESDLVTMILIHQHDKGDQPQLSFMFSYQSHCQVFPSRDYCPQSREYCQNQALCLTLSRSSSHSTWCWWSRWSSSSTTSWWTIPSSPPSTPMTGELEDMAWPKTAGPVLPADALQREYYQSTLRQHWEDGLPKHWTLACNIVNIWLIQEWSMRLRNTGDVESVLIVKRTIPGSMTQ